MDVLLGFLSELEKNNNRDWFQEHKPDYQAGEEAFKLLVHEVQEELQEKDNIDVSGTKIFRIYKDVRFSKDKTPYNLHRSASFKRATNELRGGYYLRVQRGGSRIAGGFFAPEPADLLHIRKQIQQDPEPLRQLLELPDYVTYFNGLEGDQVKTAPKGFDKTDSAIDLLRHKSFIVNHTFTDAEVLSEDFGQNVVAGFEKMRPFFDYMSEVLTHDLNGIPLVK